MTTTTRTVSTKFVLNSLLAAVMLSATFAAGQSGEESRVVSEIPGFDFSKLPAPAKKELATVLSDEFDYCGRPMTLLGSLKKGDACRHTKRLVGYAAHEAIDGVTASEIIVTLSKHNQSFAAKRAQLKIDERACTGPKDAKVTLIEFSDFECPYCNAARPMFEETLKKRAVRLCWSPFPLSSHPNAAMAGQAALFARDAGKFQAMHDALFDNQTVLSDAFIKGLVKKVGLDVAAFEKAVASKKYLEEMKASKEAGIAAGVDSTPSVFINGRKHNLGFSVENLTLSIDDELEWQTANNSWPVN